MNLCRLTFEFDGHTVEVFGYHHRAYAGGRYDPPSPECFSISRAEIVKPAEPDDPVSIDDLDEDDLAAAALRAWRERDEYERCQYADMRREEIRLGARL